MSPWANAAFLVCRLIPCPILRTHLFLGKPDTEENRASFVSTISIRPSQPVDIANACCYLASEEASFTTGVNFDVSLILVPPDRPGSTDALTKEVRSGGKDPEENNS